jgi:hypothetical protein
MQACLSHCQYGCRLSVEITAKSSALPSSHTSFRLVPVKVSLTFGTHQVAVKRSEPRSTLRWRNAE